MSFIKKYWKGLVSFFVIGIVIIPMLIHWAYKTEAPCAYLSAVWTAGDALAFYGVILGAIATVVGVYMSIQYSQQASKNDMYDRVRPFLVIAPMMVEGRVNLVEELLVRKEHDDKESGTYYKEYILDRICFILKNGTISAHSRLTEEQEEAKRKFGRRQIETENGELAITSADVTTMSIVVENLGVGVANKLLVGVNPEKVNEEEMHLVPALKVNASIIVELYVENPQPTDYGKYILSFEYQDIYENIYRQCYPVTLSKRKLGSELFIMNEGEQESLGKG